MDILFFARAPTIQARVICATLEAQQFGDCKINKKNNKKFSQNPLTNADWCAIIQVQTKQREVLIMNTIVTNAELIFWCVVGVALIALFIAIPFINNYLLNKEAEELLGF